MEQTVFISVVKSDTGYVFSLALCQRTGFGLTPVDRWVVNDWVLQVCPIIGQLDKDVEVKVLHLKGDVALIHQELVDLAKANGLATRLEVVHHN